MAATRPMLANRPSRVDLFSRTGLSALSRTSNTISRPGMSQRGCRPYRSGRRSCSATATTILATGAANDVTAFRTNLEHWYDDQMARVSGWYKRHVRSVSLVVGLVLVLSFNLNVLSIARSIYTDQALRGSVVTQATQASQCGSKDPATCLADIRAEIDRVRGDGLPIGWAEVQACSAPHADCNWPEQKGLWGHGHQFPQAAADVLLLLLGWGLMVIALLPGARFWFDALSQLGSLRSTGPKPTTATPQA